MNLFCFVSAAGAGAAAVDGATSELQEDNEAQVIGSPSQHAALPAPAPGGTTPERLPGRKSFQYRTSQRSPTAWATPEEAAAEAAVAAKAHDEADKDARELMKAELQDETPGAAQANEDRADQQQGTKPTATAMGDETENDCILADTIARKTELANNPSDCTETPAGDHSESVGHGEESSKVRGVTLSFVCNYSRNAGL
eukprot:SAG31_NODE_1745_length_7379_cov_8.772115_9_plen_199_part_00